MFEIFVESGGVDFAAVAEIVFGRLGLGFFYDLSFIGKVTGTRTIEVDIAGKMIEGETDGGGDNGDDGGADPEQNQVATTRGKARTAVGFFGGSWLVDFG